MSLTGAMNASVLGLQANAMALGASSDDTVNSRSIAYKHTQATFSTLISSSSGTAYVTGGVSVGVQRLVEQVGTPTQTNSSTDLYVDGQGFFVVKTQIDNSGKTLFTRVGDFFPDSNKKLKNSFGHYLQGWRTDSNGGTLTSNLNALTSLETVDISVAVGVGQPTENFRYGLNLPEQSIVGQTYVNNQTFYDSLGAPHTVAFTWTKTVSSPQTWTLGVTSADGVVYQNSVGSGQYVNVPIVFDGHGSPLSFNGDSSSNASMPKIAISWTNGANPSLINLDVGHLGALNGVTSYHGENTVTAQEQDGSQPGNFSYVNIDDQGIVTAFFDNQTSVKIYKVPLAVVPNPRGLKAESGNAFVTSAESGNFTLNIAGKGGAGMIRSQKLEESTVDIASVFAEMTLCNQNFSACSESFRTANEMFRELKQLQR